jgi:DNA-binding response OmpR family regulator
MVAETKIKVLLAEDDKFISKAYSEGLKNEGLEFKQVANGKLALELMKEFKPNIVLLDLMMPIKSGFEVLTEMRLDAELKKIPVIILSNLGQESDIKKGKELGAVDYLIKSDHSLNDVIQKIKEQAKI